MRAWLTPDNSELSDFTISRSICFSWPLAKYIGGALRLLTEPWNWEQFGDASIEDTCNYFKSLYDSWLENSNMIGQIAAFINVPACWLELNGQSVLQADYPELAGIVPNDWIDGNAILLPDMASRTLVGDGNGVAGEYALGTVGGAEQHALANAEMPAHNHQYSQPNLDEILVSTIDASGVASLQNGALSANTNTKGSGQPHNNMPPYLVVKFAIHAGR